MSEDGIDRTPAGLKAAMNSPAFNLARQRMQKNIRKTASLPHTGIWYWVFLKPEWKLFTWDFPLKDKIDFLHVQVWPDLVRNHMRPHYKLDEDAILAASDLPYAFPRGRVTAVVENGLLYLFIRHGNDTPIPNGLRQVEDKFKLTQHVLLGQGEEIYDPHETMVAEQRTQMEAILAHGKRS